MPICNPTDLKAFMKQGQRLLGLDVGTKTIGMALSDTRLVIATPLDTIRRTRFRDDLARILAARWTSTASAASSWACRWRSAGGEGPRTQGVRQFAKNLLAQRDLPLTFWDERMSTAAVERGMIEADLSRARRARIVDRAAAAYILQGLLDRLARGGVHPL